MTTETNSSKLMKKSFYKTDFFKIAATALITSLIFLTYFYFTDITYPVVSPNDMNKLISVTDAQGLIQQYKDDRPLKTLDAGNQVQKLEAFIFSRAVLEDILHRNKILDDYNTPQKPDAILFYLGQDGTFPDNQDQQHPYPNYRLIAIGMKNGALLLPKENDYSNKLKSSIYDKARPCPGMGCPPPPPPPPVEQ